MVDKVSRKNFDEASNRIDERENFNEIQDDFKLILFTSYNSKNNAIMHEILSQASKLNKKYNLNKFDYHMRTKDDIEWTKDYFEECLQTVSQGKNKLYLCGPVGFMEVMKSNIMKTGKIHEDDVYYI